MIHWDKKSCSSIWKPLYEVHFDFFFITLYMYLIFFNSVSMILSVSFHGSDHGTNEGRVGFTSQDSPSQVKLFTNEAWSMNTSHLVCQHLGYSRGAYATLSGNVYNTTDSNASPEYGAIRCDQDARNISECWYESRPRDSVSSDMIIAVVCCTCEYYAS